MLLNYIYLVASYLSKLYINFKTMIVVYVDDEYDIAMNFIH